jgi:hypothetical protein
MPRKPVGTNSRPTADWFAGSTATAGGLARGAAAGGVLISLYNDAPAGQYLWIWDVDVYNDAEGPYRFDEFEGDTGTLLQQGVYTTAGRGAAFGHTSWSEIAAIAESVPNSTGYAAAGYNGDEAGTTTCFRNQGPRKVLPSGYSWGVFNEWGGGIGNGATLGVTFYYTILPYIPS